VPAWEMPLSIVGTPPMSTSAMMCVSRASKAGYALARGCVVSTHWPSKMMRVQGGRCARR
jgi:hypothetical protein